MKTIIRASGGQARGIPGAYRDRYLDRVTINTDPGEGGPGALSGDRVAKSLILTYTPSPLLLSLAAKGKCDNRDPVKYS